MTTRIALVPILFPFPNPNPNPNPPPPLFVRMYILNQTRGGVPSFHQVVCDTVVEAIDDISFILEGHSLTEGSWSNILEELRSAAERAVETGIPHKMVVSVRITHDDIASSSEEGEDEDEDEDEDEVVDPAQGAGEYVHVDRPATEEQLGHLQVGAPNGSDCSICQELMANGQAISMFPCTHMYHRECILVWLQVGNTCPLCRRAL